MGNVFAEITLENVFDAERVQTGQITASDARNVTLTAIVDTGATSLVINEDIFKQLGLTTVGQPRIINIAGGGKIVCKVAGPVRIHWKDRFATVDAVVMPEGKTLLGVIPLEFMDLIVDPVRQELVGAHGDEAMLMAM